MSTSNAQPSVPKRPYRLGKRAVKQDETRQRIVEATVELHSTVGPARTTVSQIAELAGVQRHTFYAHFPDERGLNVPGAIPDRVETFASRVEKWLALRSKPNAEKKPRRKR